MGINKKLVTFHRSLCGLISSKFGTIVWIAYIITYLWQSRFRTAESVQRLKLPNDIYHLPLTHSGATAHGVQSHDPLTLSIFSRAVFHINLVEPVTLWVIQHFFPIKERLLGTIFVSWVSFLHSL